MENNIIVTNVLAFTQKATSIKDGKEYSFVYDYEVIIIKGNIESKFLMNCSDYPTYGMIVLRYNKLR